MRISAVTVIVAGLSALAVVALMRPQPAASCCRRPDASTPPTDETPATLRSLPVRIEGMTCASCELLVRRALKKLHGVRMVSFNKDRATVLYDPKKVTSQKIIGAVNKLGFRASLAPSKEES